MEKAQKLTADNNSLSLLIYAQLGDAYNGDERFIESDKALSCIYVYTNDKYDTEGTTYLNTESDSKGYKRECMVNNYDAAKAEQENDLVV